MRTPISLIETAMKMAVDGASIAEIKVQLRRNGFDRVIVDCSLHGRAIRDQLIGLRLAGAHGEKSGS